MFLEVMASNSSSGKSKVTGPGASIKITPSSSPVLRPAARTPSKPTPYQSNLSLQTVVGTTTTSPNGFSSHEPSKSFALCAGSAVILADIDADDNITQRFFRARPSATGINQVTSFYNQSTPPTTPDSRSRSHTARQSVNGSPAGDWAGGGGSRTWSSREKIKAVTSVAISPNGRLLAVGETGYNPRVLIFSTAKDSPLDIPLTVLSEHTFGVRSIAFSPNSQYLATLGDTNDGFLFVWAIDLKSGAARLHSTNKCTAFVRDMCWMGQALITVGIRHVKVWRLADGAPGSPSKPRLNPDSSNPKALSGRNCLLGSLSENTFTCVASVSDNEAVVCTDTGAVCFIDDTEGGQKLSLVKYVGFGVTSLTVDIELGAVWLGGRGRKIQRFLLDDLRASVASAPPSPVPQDRDSGSQRGKKPAIISMGFLSTHMVTVDATRAIHVCPIEALNHEDEQSPEETSMPAHRDAVLGVNALKSPNIYDADFFTWSSGGTVHFWNIQGRCQATKQVELEQLQASDDDIPNELKVLRATENMKSFIAGDRYGVLRVLSAEPWQCVSEVRAHGAEVSDIAIQAGPGSCLVASSGRDRMVQLFQKTDGAFDLIQTMDEHVGAVGRLLFIHDGEKLLSCSADRTVIIRERVTRETDGKTVIAFIMSKVITLKVSPLSITLAPDDPDILVLSTIDRNIQKFDVNSGRHIHSFRASDAETTDAVVMSSLTVTCEVPGQNPKLLIGVSTTDKSIRVYDFDRDALLARESGHTEGVSDVLLLESRSPTSKTAVRRTLISTGLDGLVMIWDLSVQQYQPQEPSQPVIREDEDTPLKELTASKPPIRRILSRSELAEFQRQDNAADSPTPARDQSPPRVRRKTSRYSLAPPPIKGGNGATTPPPPSRRSPTSSTPLESGGRSPSPPSPKPKTVHGPNGTPGSIHRPSPSMDFRHHRARHVGSSEFGSLNTSTEQVCRTLRAYRRKLNGSTDQPRAAKELERELDLTRRALGERIKKIQANREAETDSSGKENDRRAVRSLHSRSLAHIPRRTPSTPNLTRKGSRRLSRTRSLDADGEG